MRDISDLPHVYLRDADCTSRVTTALATQGIAIFHGARRREDLIRMARLLITIRTHRDSDIDGITTIRQRRTSARLGSLAGFTDGELCPHTEGSAVGQPPQVLMLCCVRAADSGGSIRLVDGRELYKEIAECNPSMLTALSTSRSAYFGGGAGHLGAVFEQAASDRIVVRLRFDEAIRFSPAAAPFAAGLRQLVERRTLSFNMMPGNGYVLLNDRWLHGRTQFTGDRVMMRIIGDPLIRHALLPGFTPPTRRLMIQEELSC
jgi:hypothetical protein